MKWFVSDTHFNHANIINWSAPDTTPLGERYRPFETVQEMNDEMRRMWNLRVKPDDTVYHLGDVAFAITRDKSLDLLDGLNGTNGLDGQQGEKGDKGDKGEDGTNGQDGISFIWSGEYLHSYTIR